MKSLVAIVISVLAAVVVVQSAAADPLPGEILKFVQRPMIATPIPDPVGGLTTYYGHDESSTAYGSLTSGQYQGQYMADDFADHFSSPVVHLRWWGSYMGAAGNLGGVKRFLIAFESDVPDPGDPHDPADGYSRPGIPLLSEVVTLGPLAPASGTFTETPVAGSSPTEPVYQYNAELHCPFPQQPDTVYWLKIVALVDPSVDGPINWGWHNRDYTAFDPLAAGPPVPFPGEHDDRPIIDPAYPTPVWHFQDDSVRGDMTAFVIDTCEVALNQSSAFPQNYVNELDGPGPNGIHGGIGRFSKDLAFELYTVPEPASVAGFCVAVLISTLRPRRS